MIWIQLEHSELRCFKSYYFQIIGALFQRKECYFSSCMHNKEGILSWVTAIQTTTFRLLDDDSSKKTKTFENLSNEQDTHTELGAIQDCASRLLFCRSTLNCMNLLSWTSSASLLPCLLRFKLSLIFLAGNRPILRGCCCVTLRVAHVNGGKRSEK